MIVDTGNFVDAPQILKALKKEKITPGHITHVVNTHLHPDHVGCNYLFRKAKFIDAEEIYQKDKFQLYKGELKIDSSISILATSGHTNHDCSVLVKTNEGLVAIVGDLFWVSQDEKLAFVANKNQYQKSRKKILKISNYIIPGHNNMFKVN